MSGLAPNSILIDKTIPKFMTTNKLVTTPMLDPGWRIVTSDPHVIYQGYDGCDISNFEMIPTSYHLNQLI